MIILTVHNSESHAPYILKNDLETAIERRYQDRAQSLLSKLLCRNVNPIAHLDNGEQVLDVIKVAALARRFGIDICLVNPRGQILNLDLLLDPFNKD